MLDQNIIEKVVDKILKFEKDQEFQIKKLLRPYNIEDETLLFRYSMAILNKMKGKVRISKRYVNAVIDVPYMAIFRRG